VIHDIDFLHYMLGLPDTVESTYFAGALSEHDYICAFWKYKGRDIRVKVEGGNPFPGHFPFEANFKASFEKATVLYTSSNGNELKIIDKDSIQILSLDDFNEGYRCEAEYFAQCVLNNVYPESCSAESSLDTIKLCYRHLDEKWTKL
jgi:predicted dehydrogenase